jgi:two-component system response regulator AtoC
MNVLIADDEQNIRKTLSELLSLDGISTRTAENGLAAQRLLAEEPFDAAVLDLRMPGMTGLELLEWIHESGPLIPVIVISAHGDIQDAVNAMKQGAVDYVTKPFDPEDLQMRIRRAVDDDRLRRSAAPTPVGDVDASDNEAMRSLLAIARKVAPTDSTVLITGESGTGKEVLARTIHRLSPRDGGPFVPVNLGAVPEHLIESELFGYERGAFTGATARKTGVFETAAGGTLFLDEIGEMPLHLQVKLLRVIQDRRLQRVGGTTTIPIDVRILAATNRNLRDAIQAGEFREDLFYRLNVIELQLPALRNRPEDIPHLVGLFLDRIRQRGGAAVQGIEPDAVRLLARYHFPGNIRELENIIERATLLTERDHLSVGDFAFLGINDAHRPVAESRDGELSVDDAILSGAMTLADLEAVAIRRALLRNEGHRERTAVELGITRRTLLNKMKEYGVVVEGGT